jgi:ketosteroid isomerase-like protein
MTQNNFVSDLYSAIDAKDTRKLVSNMTEDSIFRFANIPAVEGKGNITDFLDGFFQSIKSIRHSDLESWNIANVWFATGHVNYTRHDDSTLKVPFGILLKMKADLIKEFLIFVDNSELYSSKL